ncbi:MAG: zinc ribbon domain-containing protein [Candidatus Hodarchaeota archaeon]
MSIKKPSKAICQSCSMSIVLPDDKGTESDGTPSEDYCNDCYEAGEFLEPEITLKEMIESSISSTAKSMNISMEEAKNYLESVLPTLKRWREI